MEKRTALDALVKSLPTEREQEYLSHAFPESLD